MSRLIDADKIIDSLGNSDMDFAIGAVIDEQPTAFDVDKVVQQLEKRSTLAKPVGWTKSYEIVILNDAVEIVKGGGVE
jgi:hypothetical protein